MLERNGICFGCAVDELHEFMGKSMLRCSLGWVFLMLLHEFPDIFQGQKGKHLQIALDGVIWGSHEVLNTMSITIGSQGLERAIQT